uniref:Uncharacterized protein n=1 Tax=Anguilla anguilla TaxID=7936 RepID=A0A0E9W5Z0_ANGAN
MFPNPMKTDPDSTYRTTTKKTGCKHQSSTKYCLD